MSKFSDLPIEIWLLIASYVPESQFFHLKSLNGFFLDHWMDTNWDYVEIDTDTTKAVPLLLRVLYVNNQQSYLNWVLKLRVEIHL